jgi:hypothetical protein
MNAVADRTWDGGDVVGEYRLLNKYLRDRFADRVVLTFEQIEDLLGFCLAGPAWVEREWWGRMDSRRRRTQSDAWALAGRIAKVNLSAQCVMFEREAPY